MFYRELQLSMHAESKLVQDIEKQKFVMQIMEIDDPVVDQKGYVYERQVIEEYIRSEGGKTRCPATGKATCANWPVQQLHDMNKDPLGCHECYQSLYSC